MKSGSRKKAKARKRHWIMVGLNRPRNWEERRGKDGEQIRISPEGLNEHQKGDWGIGQCLRGFYNIRRDWMRMAFYYGMIDKAKILGKGV